MRKNLFRTARFLAVSGVMISFISCGSGTKSSQDSEEAIDLQMKKKIVEDVKKVMISLPSPVETAMLLKRAGAIYNEALLNPVSNAKKYNTDKQKALNLGVYGADLSYASIFEQDAIVMQYMNVSKKLAIGLDLLTAIDQSIVDRLEANHDNRDSVVRIISETFLNSNSTLKEDNRPETAALILAGGWIEGLYLATSLADSIQQENLITRIAEQKLSFNELIQLLETYSDNKDVANVLESLSPVKTAFDNVEIKKEKVEVVTDIETQKSDFKSVQKINITQEQYDTLKSAALELRNSIIQ
ncbi:MAG: hypothetical protein R6U95_03655 [Bacteroidales bacterium]